MPTKLISFIGTAKMSSTTYRYGDQTHTTCFMADAAATFFKPDQLLVVGTKKSHNANFELLKQSLAANTKLEGRIEPQPVVIAPGANQDELWSIFDELQKYISPKDEITDEEIIHEIIFDITNTLRSLPVIALIVASYLRVVRNVTLKHMVYGAFDLSENGVTPVLDLSPLIQLFDWTTATDTFVQAGRFTAMQSLITQSGDGVNPDLVALADTMNLLSRSLLTTRPALTLQTAHKLQGQLEKLEGSKNATPGPFSLLLEQIKQEYGNLGLENPYDQQQAHNVLDRLLKVIQWYVKKDLPVHAMTLTREWLVSVVVYYREGDIFDDRRSGDRAAAEDIINGRTRLDKATTKPSLLQTLPIIQQLWKRVSTDPSYQQAADLRNDLAHAGMRRQARHPDEIAEAMQTICKELDQLLP